MLKISFKVTNNQNFEKINFFNTTQSLCLGEEFTLPGQAKCKALSGFNKGISSLSIITFILENINSISLGLLSAYIYDQLKPQDVKNIEINGKEVPLEKKAIEEELAKYKYLDKDD